MKNKKSTALLIFALIGSLNAVEITVFDDTLQNGFQDWSWAVHNLNNNTPVNSGSVSISMQADNWDGLLFHKDTQIDVADNNRLSFYIHGGNSGGQSIRVYFQNNGLVIATVDIPLLVANSWQQVVVSLSDLGVTFGGFQDIVFQDNTGTDQPEIYLDDIVILENIDPPITATPITINVNINQDRHVINDEIYGVNFGSVNQLNEIKFPSRRWGGNSTSRYNWKTDISSRGSDWFYLQYANAVDDENQLPHGSSSDVFIDETMAVQSQAIITIPMTDWVPLDDRNRKWGFSVLKYGQQLETECSIFDNPPNWCNPDAGNGTCNPLVNTSGYCSSDGYIINNEVSDTSQNVNATWVSDWVAHIASRVGDAANGGVKYWALDNEPMLWNSTHRDIHPNPVTYDELWNKTLSYATAIKNQDSNANILGPTLWGWCAYFTSASDAEYNNGSCVDGPDRQAHGGVALIPWYLNKVCEHEENTGVRLVDYLDIHYYPQGGVAGLSDSNSSEDNETAAKRLRSIKELYDPTYTAESWINEPIYMLPRLHSWIDDNCPGTKLAITEYKWGSDNGASGVLAQAEVLAIFGREQVDLATRWVAPEEGSKVENAFKLYLDYDGNGAKIQGESIQVLSGNIDEVGSYGIHNITTNHLYILLFNKHTTAKEATINLGQTSTQISVYGFDAGDDISFLENITPANSVVYTLPERSVRLLVIDLSSDLIFANGFD